MDKTPHIVDLHVGLKIRQRRRDIGMSQEFLAHELGLSFQQVQKYERGSNRISASKLFETSRVLRVSVSFFYEGLDVDLDVSAELNEQRARESLVTAEGAELSKAIGLLPPKHRRSVLSLVRDLATEDDKL